MSGRPFVAIYADESCLGNGREGENPGGAGVLVEFRQPSGEMVRRDLWVSAPATTNNQMALRSVIDSLTAIAHKGHRFRVRFTTDSRYIVDGMSKWVHDWARRDWRRKAGAIENLELWQAAVRAASPHQIEWNWVRGHAGHGQNEYANHLAIRAAEELSTSGGLVESSFEVWAAGFKHKGKGVQIEPFPDEAHFRPGHALPRTAAGSL